MRIEITGTIDELNSAIGLAGALKPDHQTAVVLAQIQNDLCDLGAELATLPADYRVGMPRIGPRHITALEKLIDQSNAKLGPLKEFILPGGTPAAAQLQVARTVCRRAERLSVRLAQQEKTGEWILPYLNRLGDALFMLARWVNLTAATPEKFWRKPPVNPARVSRCNATTMRRARSRKSA